MKKSFLIINIIILILAFTLCSCGRKTNIDNAGDKYLTRIYEIDNEIYNVEKDFNHSNIVSDQTVHSTVPGVASKTKLHFDGIEKEFVYFDTLYYPIGEKKVHKYITNEEQVVLLNQDGTVNALLFDFATLNISETAKPNEVLSVLESELVKWVDISQYEHLQMPESVEDDQKFGMYYFLYYNTEQGYLTDYVRVSVLDDGRVFGLSINNLNSDGMVLNIDKELENKMIDLKLKDIYTTESTEYISYNVVVQPRIVVFNDVLYVLYSVSANYLTVSGEQMSSFANSILIPVDLVAATV